MARWPHQAPVLECHQVDLVRDLGGLDPADFDGIVSTALFDLVSAEWGERFTAWLDQALRPVLLTLSVDGRLDWTPQDPADTAMRVWIEAHQATDKGFGPALVCTPRRCSPNCSRLAGTMCSPKRATGSSERTMPRCTGR